jgi:hypothetical protein
MSQYQPDYMSYPPGGAPPAGLAIASMVCGIVSLVLFCVYAISIPCAIVAITLGLIAKSQIRRGAASGNGMAITGIICGALSLVLVTVLVAGALVVMIVTMIAARKAVESGLSRR